MWRRRTEDRLAHRLTCACQRGDGAALVRTLHPDVELVVDGVRGSGTGGRLVRGVGDVAEMLVWLLEPAGTVEVASVNGSAGLVARTGNQVVAVLSLAVAERAIARVWAITDPARLRHWNPSE